MDQEFMDTMFTGAFEHTLDAKGRVSLPAKARRYLPSTVKCALSLDNKAIYVFSPEAFNAWVKSIFADGFNATSKKHLALRSRLMTYSDDADIDSAGRIGLPAKLRDIVGLKRDVTIVGGGDHLEIVDREAFKAIEEDLLSMDFLED